MTDKVLVMSDIHIGDPRLESLNRVDRITKLISNWDGNRIILNGDIVDLWINDDADYILNHPIIVELVDAVQHGKQVYWVVGNHDHGIAELIGERVPFFNFCSKLASHDMLFIHGHQLDLRKDKWWYAKLATKWNIWVWKKFKFDIQMWWHTRKLYQGECWSDRRKLLKKCDTKMIVMGHTHRVGHQFLMENNDVGREVFDIGSTMELGTYGIVKENKISLHRI